MHKNGAGYTQTFPELWNSAAGSLAGAFRIACRDGGLEGMLELADAREPARRTRDPLTIERHRARNPALTRADQRISFNP
jgi:hypothetical protein